MKKQNIKFFENFIATFGGSIGFLIALQAKGLDYLKNYQDFIMWILILLIFIFLSIVPIETIVSLCSISFSISESSILRLCLFQLIIKL